MPDGNPDGACPELVEGLMHVSGKWIQHVVGVLLVKIFWTSKISCAARIGPYEKHFLIETKVNRVLGNK